MADSTAPSPENPAVANSQQPPPGSDNKTSQSDPSPALPPPPPSIQPYSAVPPPFRPAPPPAPVPGGVAPMFSPLPNPNLQQQTPNFPNPSVQPPGVSSVPPSMIPAPTAGAGPVQMASAPQMMPPYAVPGQMMRPYAHMPNGYPAMPQPPPQGAMLHPGIPRYASPYTQMARPVFPPRPPGAVGMIPPLMRPPIPIIRPPIIPPAARPAAIPSISQTEKPQTTVYVGKISSIAENEFMLSLLQLCGPVRSWKRAQDPTNGSLRGFGFCEFESAEGVLRALRLLNKLNIDGQELMLNVNQATRDYLERYVEKKAESSKKPKESETEGTENEEESASGGEKNEDAKSSIEPPESTTEESKKDGGDKGNKENPDAASFGLVTDEDRQADKEASEKLKDMIEERLKNKPLPPPPQHTAKDVSDNSYTENLKDGEPARDTAKNDKNDDVIESKTSSEHDKAEISSPDHRRHDRRSRDWERDLKREKERELERYERERKQERAEREYKTREDDRRYKVREKDWETREREREHWRKREREREKERAQERKWDIVEQERECEDGYRKRKHRTSDEERKRRQREKEDDLADKFKEEEEIAEAKRRAEEEQQQKEQEAALKILSGHLANGREKAVSYEENNLDGLDKNIETADDNLSQGEGVVQNGTVEESVLAATAASDMKHDSNAPAKRLEFGLLGSGKRAAVSSFFNADEDEDTQKEKKMRPLVPIDYSADEQHVAQPSISEGSPAVVAEVAKRILNVNPKEERPDGEDRHRRNHGRSSQRDRGKHDEETNRTRDDSRNLDHDRLREPIPDKVKMPDKQKLLDAKQLIDMIPKTKDELFSYEINWAIYDKNALHERMRPWISKKITDFLGEEEPTLVDYIVSSTQEHVKATEMLERLQSILDEEAEMFVLKMWRMLIFEIKKVETGLALRPKS